MNIFKKPFPAMAGGLLTPLALVLAVTLAGRAGSQPAYAQRPTASTPSAQISAGSPSDFRDDSVGMEMVFVEGGTFTMGCTLEQGSDCDDDARPPRSVTVGNFYIGKHEVTQRLWVQVMNDANPSRFIGSDLPVENVSWNDIQTFISKLNFMTNRFMTGPRYRLPTEAEWEYAARGGAKSMGFKYSGGNNIDEVAWYYVNSGNGRLDENNWDSNELWRNKNRTRQVGTKRGNELGIHDMSGNVWEWVNDWIGSYEAGAVTDPQGPASGSHHVFRGGSWNYREKNCRVSTRSFHNPNYRNPNIGFRLAVSP